MWPIDFNIEYGGEDRQFVGISIRYLFIFRPFSPFHLLADVQVYFDATGLTSPLPHLGGIDSFGLSHFI